MAIDINKLMAMTGKVENDGADETGTLSAQEFNTLVLALIEALGGVKKISFQGTTFAPDSNGVLHLVYSSESNTYQMVAKVTTTPPEVLVKGASCPISFEYNCYYGSDVTDVDTSPGSASFMINGTLITALTTSLRATGSNENSKYTVDIGQYLTEEENTVTLVISNTHGTSRVWDFTVATKSINLSFDASYDQTIPRSGKWELRVSCLGTEADVHLMIDDNPDSEQVVHIASSTYNFVIDADGSLAAGRHKVSVWAVNAEYGITTEIITSSFIKTGSQNTILAIGSGAPISAPQYDTVSIPYFFYIPGALAGQSVNVGLAIYDNNGILTETLTSQIVPVSATGSSGLQMASFVPSLDTYVNNDITLRISIGGAYVEHILTITSAGVSLSAADECKVYYSFAGRTNSDEDAENLVSTYDGQQTSRLVRSENFKLNSFGGFITKNGFTIPAGRKVTLKDWLMFGADFGANAEDQTARTGRTLEIEMEAGLCSDMNTPIVSCMDGNTGFEIYPNRLVVKCPSASGGIDTEFPDQARIRMSIVIDGQATHCVAETGNANTSANFDAWCNIAYLYVNGTCVRIFDYKTASWAQDNPKEIVFGSDDCEVILYSIRAYDKSLTYKQVNGNFAFDTPNLADKIAIAKRNDILNSDGTVSFQKVQAALPNTPLIVWDLENLPTSKSDERTITGTEFINPEWNAEDYGRACAPFTSGEHLINGDGTSSNNYPLPYKNWAEEFFTLVLQLASEGTVEVEEYSITPGIDGGETEFVHKVNFASCEKIFNMLTMNFYQHLTLACANGTFQSLLTKFMQQQSDLGNPITFRKSLSGFPEIGFRKNTKGGQNNPSFLSIYNFINNKYSRSFLGFPKDHAKAQIWEVDDNKNFFSQEIFDSYHKAIEVKDPDTGAVSMIDTLFKSNAVDIPLYYARVPKKSSVTGQKLGVPGSIADIDQANSELAVLKRFHNFIYKCNPNVAERYYARYGDYRTLTIEQDGYTSRVFGSVTYTKDTPAYRKAMFKEEAENYMYKQDAIFYFVFFVYFLGTDSMDKNMSVAFDDVTAAAPLARIFPRDSDTIWLFNNSGIRAWRYWHEWGDSYDANTDTTGRITGEVWNAQTQSYDLKTSAGSEIFNGRLSGLWDLVDQCWADDVKAMYDKMAANGLDAATLMKWYRGYWSYWCENLYNADAMGYANTGNFAMAYGDKLMQSEYFTKYRSRYLDSKFKSGQCTINNTMIRLFTSGKGVSLRHCCPIYACIAWGSGNYVNQRSIIAGEPALMPNGITDSGGEQVFVLCNNDLITHVGTYTQDALGNIIESGLEGLGQVYFQTGMTGMVRLRELVMDYSGIEGGNTKQDDAGWNVSNFRLLRRLIARRLVNVVSVQTIVSGVIQEIDYRETPISGISIPETDSLVILRLPATLTALNLKNLPSLSENFSIEGYEVMKSLSVIGCPGLDTYTMVHRLMTESSSVQSVIIDEVSWPAAASTIISSLANTKTCQLAGEITISGGNQEVTFAMKMAMIEKWGDIDSGADGLTVKYSERAIVNALIFGTDSIEEPGTFKYSVTPATAGGISTAYGNTVKNIAWSISDNAYASIDQSGTVTVSAIGVEDAAGYGPEATVKAVLTLKDGSTLETTKVIRLYKRSARLGDFVFADGTYSDRHDGTKTCIGVCCYIDQEDPTLRLAVGLKDMSAQPYGLFSHKDYPDYSIYDIVLESGYDPYDLPITNVTSSGLVVTEEGGTASYISDATYRDESENGTPDGFRKLAAGTACAQIGLVELTKDLHGHKKGEKLPWGQYLTLEIIDHRDRVLAETNHPIPAATADKTELEVLDELLAQIVQEAGGLTKYKQFYYPMASRIFAYEPTVIASEVLSDKFKAGNWFLPSEGELARICWHHFQGYEGGEHAIFSNAVQAGIMTSFSASWFGSSSEYTNYGYWVVNFGSGGCCGTYKYGSDLARGLVAF